MADAIPLEKKFAVLCQITRAQHFAWRAAVRERCPDVDIADVVRRMWELTGADTAKAYAQRIDGARPLAPQVAEQFVRSSLCMGETADVEPGVGRDEAFVRHSGCPWLDWHERQGALAEDLPGCDAWFQATIAGLNRALGSSLRCETLAALPNGDDCCRRRIWSEGR